MKVGKALKLVMTSWHISNYRLSQLSGVGQATIGKLIRGEHQSTSWDKVEQLANGLEQVHSFTKVAFLFALSRPDDDYKKLRNPFKGHEPFDEIEALEDIAVVIKAYEIIGLLDHEAAQRLSIEFAKPFYLEKPLLQQLELLLLHVQREANKQEREEESNE